ncbi:MAG: hypothetical protein PHP61_01990 [Candidatus Izemoplasmatales bacterium]|jgi:uncharacterized protein|nr:hypothetical protein [Candidatus Izemoplasmatales bacterium]MDY0372505.1 hypothetical protein [Candidatus Izemoplasmatales bacterium]
MKFSLQELRKQQTTDNRIDFVSDCSSFITSDLEDLVGISPVQVSGTYFVHEADNRYIFDLRIRCHCIMLCAVTLEEVTVPLDFETILEFSEKITDDYTFPIQGTTIDLDPIIFSEILVEKPMRALSPNANQKDFSEIVKLDDEERLKDNPFSKLKNKS